MGAHWRRKTMKLQKMKQGAYFLCLPISVIRAKGWEKGDIVRVKITETGDLILKKES